MSGEPSVQVHHVLTHAERHRAMELLDVAAIHGGGGLDDLLAADLAHGPNPGFVGVTAEDADGRLLAYAEGSTANDGMSIGYVLHPAESGSDVLLAAVMGALLAALPSDQPVTWWATDREAELAATLGLVPHRRLLDMRVDLPLATTTDLAVRGFRVGDDDAGWLDVNNAAFAWHGEQGGWTLATLQQRQQEPWFDADGFLVHERDGRMAGFCWTKLHRQPALVGEIYVIAVHPDFHGLGLGRALTVAGLQHLHDVDGAPTAKLFVDAGNTAAVTLYDHLGFTVADAKQAYLRPAVSHTRQGST